MPADEPLGRVVGSGATEGQFNALEGGDVHCFSCGRDFPAAGVDADEARRLEGVSDPADMLLVVALTCPHCAASGTLILGYGPGASVADADVVVGLPRSR